MERIIGCGAALLAAVFAVACTDEKPPPNTVITSTRAPAAAVATTKTPEPVAKEEDASKANVVVDPRIREACNMPTPHFEFDSASVHEDPALDVLAKCFATGPMAGKAMRLVGHADPRGDFDYNMALGQKRAGNVAQYLQNQGVTEGHIATTSRGEMDATGVDEAGWTLDRRVDVLLAD